MLSSNESLAPVFCQARARFVGRSWPPIPANGKVGRMCLLALFYRVAEDAPVVVGANREEFYQRGGEPPRILEGPIRSVAGVDPVAGGTWIGVNEHGVMVAVTNRLKTQVPAYPRSRGLLARELLTFPDAR